jgi:hypothetical protein
MTHNYVFVQKKLRAKDLLKDAEKVCLLEQGFSRTVKNYPVI